MKKIYSQILSVHYWAKMIRAMMSLFIIFLLAATVYAQETVYTSPTWAGSPPTVDICAGGTVTVYVDLSTSGHTYRLLNFPGAIIIEDKAGTGGTISFTPLDFSSTGVFNYTVLDINDAVPTTNFYINVIADPVASTMTKSPDQTNVCDGANVSASVNVAGSGGVSCSDNYFKSINGGSWVSYIPGDPISTTGLTSVGIQAKRGGCGGSGCDEATSATYSWIIDPLSEGGAVTPSLNVCYAINSTLLTLSGQTGIVVKWQWSTTNADPWTDITNTATTYTATNIAVDTYFRAVVQSGVCSEAYSDAALIEVDPFPTEVWVDDDFTSATSGWLCDHFNTIQAGIDRLEDGTGGTVNVAEGDYTEQLTIHMDVILEGAGIGLTVVKAPSGVSNCVAGITGVGVNWQSDYLLAAYPLDWNGTTATGTPITVKVSDMTFDANGTYHDCGRYSGVFFGCVKGTNYADAGLFNSSVINFSPTDPSATGVRILGDSKLSISGCDNIEYTINGIAAYGDLAANPDPDILFDDNTLICLKSSLVWTEYALNVCFGATGTVCNNTVTDPATDGLLVSSSNNVTVTENIISNQMGNGIILYNANNCIILKNQITSTHSGDVSTPGNCGWGIGLDGTSANNTIGDGTLANANDITTNDAGIIFYGTGTGNTAIGNKIYGNSPHGLNNFGGAVVTATGNWWGSATGPTVASNPCGSGNTLTNETNVTYEPWKDGLATWVDVYKLAAAEVIVSHVDVKCKGDATGSVTVAATIGKGIAPYEYKIGAGSYQPGGTFSGLLAGNFTVTVRDANLCTVEVPVTVTEPALALAATITAQTDVSCNGNSTGSVTVTATTGTGTSPYEYKLGAGSYQLSGTFSGLNANSYTVTAKDANLCTVDVPVIITEPDFALAATITAQTNVSCFGFSDGTVTVTATTGTGTSPYEYKLGAGSYQSSGTFPGLIAGNYTVTARDAKLCTVDVPVIITEPDFALAATITAQTNVSCFGFSDGTVTVTATAGTGTSPYEYKLGVTGSYQSSGTFSGLIAGNYTVTARDFNLCTVDVPVTITQPAALVHNSTTGIGYCKIQEAIDAALPGETISVDAGEFPEQLLIQKDLILIGAGITQTIVKAPATGRVTAPGYTAQVWTADNWTTDYLLAAYPVDPINGDPISVKITGFTFDADGQSHIGSRFTGVYFRKVFNTDIADAGLFDSKIMGFSTSDPSVTGIRVLESSRLTLNNNILTDYTILGIVVYGTDNLVDPIVVTSLNNLTPYESAQGIQYRFINGTTTSGEILSNTITGGSIPIAASYSDHLLIDPNIISNSQDVGILLEASSYCTVQDNIITNFTTNGIEVVGSYNDILGNEITDNTGYCYNGIYLYNAGNNTLRGNTISEIHSGDISTPGACGWGIGVDGTSASNAIGDGTLPGANDVTLCDAGIVFYGAGTGNSAIGNKIHGNSPHGLNNHGGATINATGNWWGDPTGPTVAGYLCGIGDALTDPAGVIYEPWKDDANFTNDVYKLIAYSLSGTIAICEGGVATITLSSSQVGTNYEYRLYRGLFNVGAMRTGDGDTLKWNVTEPAAGSFTYTVKATNTLNSCLLDMTDDAVITVEIVPASQDITKDPDVTEVCTDGNVSATFSGGAGGVSPVDHYEYSINGGANWSDYTPATNISSSVAGVARIQIRTWRTSSGAGCTTSGYNTVSWVVIAQPASQDITKNPNVTEVCTDGQVSATFTGGSGGVSPVDHYESSIDGGGTWQAYTPEDNLSSAVAGVARIQIRTWRTSTGTNCNTSSYNTVSWDVLTQPVQQDITKNPDVTEVCTDGQVSATFTGGSGGVSPVDHYEYSINGGVTWFAYTSGTMVSSSVAGTARIQIQTWRTSAGTGCNTSATNTVSWDVIAQPAPQTIAKNPDVTEVCTNGTVSATFSGGSGGISPVDHYESSINGGGTWLAYTPGANLSSSVAGVARIQIRTWRTSSGTNCNMSGYSTVSWDVLTQPAPKSITKLPDQSAVCALDYASATFTGGSGGVNPVDYYQSSVDAGVSWQTYVPGANLSTSVVGPAQIRIRTWRESAGTGCNISGYNTVSWNVNPLPTPSVSGPATACSGSAGHVYTTVLVTGNVYLWTVTGGNITFGQGTNQITVTWGAGTSGTVEVAEFIQATTCSAINSMAVTIVPLPAPTVAGPVTAVVNTSAVYSTTIVPGYAYSWSVTGGVIQGPGNLSSVTVLWGNTPGTGTVTVTELNITSGCIGYSAPYYVTITAAGVKISGYFTYYNAANTPLDGMTILLKQGVNTVATTTSAVDGYYEFTGVSNNTYSITATTTKAEGGVNVTDAGQVNIWWGAHPAIERVKWNTGNVDGGASINSTDAGLIRGHFVNGTPFTAGVWTFWQQPDVSGANPPAGVATFAVTGSDITRNYYGRCVGDFNGNYTPPAGTKSGNTETSLSLTYNGTRQVGAGEVFELPVEAVNNMQIGAISLIINFPADLVSIEDVYLNDGNTGVSEEVLSYNVSGNELRIGWNSLTPLMLNSADALVSIKMRTSASFATGQVIRISVTADPLNELADGFMNPIPDAILSTYTVEFSTFGLGENDLRNDIALANYPNPFEEFTMISYTLPADGQVSLEIGNMMGKRVAILVNENQSSGKYLIKLDGILLNPGIYTATLSFNAKGDVMHRTIKLVHGTK